MKRNFFLLIQGLTPIVIVEAIGEIVTEIQLADSLFVDLFLDKTKFRSLME